MSTLHSDFTLHSDTSAIFEAISQKSQTEFLFKLESSNITDKMQQAVWEAFGSYIRRQLKQGKSVQIPRFGKFTFPFNTVNPNNTFDDFSKLKDQRKPLFVISKDFITGKDIKAGTFTDGGMTPYPSLSQTMKVQEATLNLVEIACEAGTTKDNVRLCLQRVFREIISSVKKNQIVSLDIPSLGTLHIRSGIAAVKFYDAIVEDLRIPVIRDPKKKSLFPSSPSFQQGKFYGLMSSYKIGSFADDQKPIYLDESASQYLRKEFDIDVLSLRQDSPQKPAKKLQNLDYFPREEGFFKPPSTAPNMSLTSSQRMEANTGINRVLLWIRNQRISPTEAFYELVTDVYGIEGGKDSRLTYEDFGKALKKMDLKLSIVNSKNLFNAMDKNKDGFIDLNDWISSTAKEEAPAKVLNNLLKTHGFGPSKVLEAMGIKKECSFVDRKMLYEGINKLSSNLQAQTISDVVEKLLDGKDFIDVDKLVDIMQLQQDSEAKDYDSMQILIDKVKNHIHQNQKQDLLFQDLKESSQGTDTVFLRDFKHALVKVGLRLSDTEIGRLARKYQVSNANLVGYKKFCSDVQTPNNTNTEASLRIIATRLHDYLKTKKWDMPLFLRKVSGLSEVQMTLSGGVSPSKFGTSGKVPTILFSLFLKNNIFAQEDNFESNQVAERIDIDKDGYITKEDLETFISRRNLYSKAQKLQKELEGSPKMKLFPTELLNEKDIENVLRELRGILDQRRMTNHELFGILDANEDGFVTIDEFSEQLERIIPLPKTIIEGFFAYIDRHKVGILDLESFLKVMKKSIYVREKKEVEDNFDWPVNIITEMRKYFETRGISQADAFKIVDLDFDGDISVTDLTQFLLKIMDIEKEEITEPRVERLFKLMDRFKRGRIQLDDFTRIFQGQLQYSQSQPTFIKMPKSLSVSQSRVILDSSIDQQSVPFDWMMNAKQQIGLVISQQFPNSRASFDHISSHTSKILYKAFKKWIEENNILQGFNLTATLLLQLFAHLDPHKKGYLTSTDWDLAFKYFDWNTQLFAEFKNVLYTNFISMDAAFGYFYPNKDRSTRLPFDTNAHFSYNDFVEGLKSVFPNRYSQEDIEYFWNKLAEGRERVTYAMFCTSLDAGKFGSKETDSNLNTLAGSASLKGTPSARYQTIYSQRGRNFGNKAISMRGACSIDTFEKLKKNIHSAKVNIVELFQQVDINKTGRVSGIEFRNVLMKLNVGISSFETSYLADMANIDKDGSIDWKSFVNRILLKESEVHLLHRYKERLTKIKFNIYKYMLTPKDAFVKFNHNGTGKMVYEEFVQFISQLYRLAGEDIPALSITRDLFNFIDMKKDGVLDINEWNQTFNNLTAFYSKEDIADPKKQAISLSKTLVEFNKVDWVNTKNYEEVMTLLGRNRKLLYNKFLDLEQRKVAITQDVARGVIKGVLDLTGLKIEEQNWGTLLKFAESAGLIEFRKLLSVFKDRQDKRNTIHRAKLLYI